MPLSSAAAIKSALHMLKITMCKLVDLYEHNILTEVRELHKAQPSVALFSLSRQATRGCTFVHTNLNRALTDS